MRIEVVVEAPTLDSVASIDVIRLGNEVARLVSNDLHGETVELIHAAVGGNADITVPRDYDEDAPVRYQGVAEDPFHPYTHKAKPEVDLVAALEASLQPKDEDDGEEPEQED